MFDSKLADYAINLFKRDGIAVKTKHNILELRRGLPEGQNIAGSEACYTLKTKQEGEIGVGMCVWSTGLSSQLLLNSLNLTLPGLMMNPFIQQALDHVHTYPSSSATVKSPTSTPPTDEKWIIKRDAKTGGLLVDDHFRTKLIPRSSAIKDLNGRTPVATMQNVFALGDVSVMERNPLPATAQVANQEAKWLGRALNKGFTGPGFTFRNLGVMTYLGDMRAIMQTGGNTEIKGYVIISYSHVMRRDRC
jgi:NADH dehydrogenase FAD-containing subunit